MTLSHFYKFGHILFEVCLSHWTKAPYCCKTLFVPFCLFSRFVKFPFLFLELLNQFFSLLLMICSFQCKNVKISFLFFSSSKIWFFVVFYTLLLEIIFFTTVATLTLSWDKHTQRKVTSAWKKQWGVCHNCQNTFIVFFFLTKLVSQSAEGTRIWLSQRQSVKNIFSFL